MISKKLYAIKWYGRRTIKKIFKFNPKINKYNGMDILSPQEGNDYILASIQKAYEKERGLFVGRYGSNELDAMVKFEYYHKGKLNRYQRSAMERLCLNAGFFPKDEKLISQYVVEMKNASHLVDIVGVWFNPFEDYILKKYAPEAKCCYLSGLEPYFYENPWSEKLQGKRVLVIHPFAESIVKQYNNSRDALFHNSKVLPDFKLEVLKAVQTIAGQSDSRFANWFEALDYMEETALQQDFDIAIIGCGAYGFPLAARLKKAGKIAIHLGGATQMLFGVKGARWEKLDSFKDIINDSWIYPIESEKPVGAEKIEDACYW